MQLESHFFELKLSGSRICHNNVCAIDSSGKMDQTSHNGSSYGYDDSSYYSSR